MQDNDAVIINFHPKRQCLHKNLIVDEQLEQITCGLCGERLNPFFAIKQLMSLSWKWKKERAALSLAREEAEKKTKTKCQHCGKITRVRTDVKDWKIINRMQELE